MNQSSLDIVSVVVFIATLLFAPNVANVVGPYIVIVVASTIGASFALARRAQSTRLSAALYFLRVNGVAVLLTVGLAALATAWRPELHERLLLAPIALVLGCVGDDFPALLRYLGGKANAVIDLLIKLKGGNSGGGGNG